MKTDGEPANTREVTLKTIIIKKRTVLLLHVVFSPSCIFTSSSFPSPNGSGCRRKSRLTEEKAWQLT